MKKYFKNIDTNEYYFEGRDHNRSKNLINGKTGSEYFLSGCYGKHHYFPFIEVSEPDFYINTDKLISRYNTPLLSKYGSKVVHYSDKAEVNAFHKWLDNTYNKRYRDVKEGDSFILWNGDSVPVPFVQMRDETPDKANRPTRLLDGSYFRLDDDMMVAIVSKDEITALKREIMASRQ